MRSLPPCLFVAAACLLGLAGSKGVYAQERRIDSLKALIAPTGAKDTGRVILYNRVFFNYIFVNIDSAFAYGNRARDLSRQIGYRKGEATYLNNLGVLHRVEGDYATSLQRLTESLAINESIRYLNGMANNYINLGLLYATQDNFPKALEYYQKCLNIKQKTGEKVGVANVWKDMGDIYGRMGNRMMAIRCYESAVNERAYPSITGRAWLAEANLYLADNQIKEADEYNRKATALIKEHDKFTLCAALNTQGNIYLAMGNILQAKAAFASALAFAQQYHNLSEEAAACLNMARVSHALGQHEQAYTYAMQCNSLTDSMHQAEKAGNMLRLQNSFEVRQREAQVRELQQNQRLQSAEFDRQQVRSQGLIAAVVLAVCLLLVLWYSLVMQNRARREITRQRDRLSEVNAEMESKNEAIQQFNHLLERKIAERTVELSRTVGDLRSYNQDLQHFSHIVSHNLRAPIASILGLISLLEGEVAKTSAENRVFLGYLSESAQRLDEIVRDLNNILNTNAVGKNREMVTLHEVMDSVLQQLAEEITHKQARIEVDFQQAPLFYSVRGYVESILYNLISNSLKYQQPEVLPLIAVTSHLDGSQLCITVRDNGQGMDLAHYSLDQYMNNASGEHAQAVRGIGLYLIRIQAEALGGDIHASSEPGQGTTFVVCLPES